MSEVKSDKLTPVTATTTTFGDSGDKLLFATGTNLDMNGTELILDADADTSITADTDDQIDIKIAGADDFQFTANTFTAQSGSTIAAQALTAALPITYSSTTGITAGTTQTQAGATALTTEINTVTAVGTDGDGVKLPTAAAGQKVRIYNADAAQYISVWPNTSDTIDGGSAYAVDGNAILFGGFREYVAYDATNWVTTSQSALSKVGSFTRDLTTAAGAQAITGIPFKPTSAIWLAAVPVDHNTSIGFSPSPAGGGVDGVLRDINNAGDGNAAYTLTWSATTTAIISFINSGVGGWVYSQGALTSFDAGGFTIAWTKNGSPSGTATITYMVSRI